MKKNKTPLETGFNAKGVKIYDDTKPLIFVDNKVTDYQDFTTKDMSIEDRRKIDVGDIWANTMECLLCHDVVRSQNRHHFVRCKCGDMFVDGGSWYQRYGATDLSTVKSLIEYYDKREE
jgi:hypothetical protein